MWQTTEKRTNKRASASSKHEQTKMEKEALDIVDLYEELLFKRAEMGYRPVIYISSECDLECSLIGMFELGDGSNGSGEDIPTQTSLEELRDRLL